MDISMKKNYYAKSKKLRILRIFLALLLVLAMLPLNAGATSGDSKIIANTEENTDELNTEDVSKNSRDNSEDGKESAEESDETPSTDEIPEENTTENNASTDTAEEETGTDTDIDADTADDSSAASIGQARDGSGLNSADDLYLDVDVRFQVAGGQEQVVFIADVNKGREALDSYVLTPTFSGDANVSPSDYSVEVYKINLDGTYSPADASEYFYESSTGEVTFTNIDACYAVWYTLDTTESFVSADMSTGDGVTVEATFDVAIAAGSSTKTVSDTHYFRPITATSPNDTLKNSSIITGYDVTDQTATSIDIVFEWALDVGLVDSNGSPLALDVSAGNYFVFTIESDAVDFYNDGSGVLSRTSDGTEVGVFYYYKDDNNNGTLIMVFNNYTENHDNITGEILVTSGFTGTVGEDVEINISTNNDTKIDEPKDATYSLDKSGVLEDSNTIKWSINVNTEQESLENLTVTDTQIISNGEGWIFIDDEIEVYKLDSSGNKSGSALVLGTDYTATLENGKWMVEFGDTSDAYVIELKAEVREPSSISSSSYTYRNTAYSDADGYNQLEASASLRKDLAAVDKSVSVSTDTANNEATTSWTLTYNGNYTTQIADGVELTDTITTPYWFSGSDQKIQDLDGYVVDTSSFAVTLYTDASDQTGTTLTPGVDYLINFSDNGSGDIESFTITFPSGSSAIDDDGNITGRIDVKYEVDVDLSNMPEGASGWRFRNSVSTDQGNSNTTNTAGSGIYKSASFANYNEQTIGWTVRINEENGLGELLDGAIIYDVLPEGFSIVENSIEIVNRSTGDSIEVIGAGESSAANEYFVVDYSAQNTTIGTDTSIAYNYGGGFQLTYYNTSGSSTNNYWISYTTTYNYDPDKLGENEAGYVNDRYNKNEAYLVDQPDSYYKAEAGVTLWNVFDNGGYKTGTFTQGTTDAEGVTAASTITWSIYANDLNTDISGATFTDELKKGLDAMEGTELTSGGTQTFEFDSDISLSDIKIYPYTVSVVSGRATRTINYSSTLWDYLIQENCIDITTNSKGNSVLTVTFPSTYKDDLETLGILTSTDANIAEANMRFAVVIETSLTNPLAAYYPNEGSLEKDNNTIGIWTAGVSVAAASSPLSKTGEILSDGSTINYSIVLNKNMDTLTGVEIHDSLMYDNDTEQQLLFLESNDSNPTGYALKVYKANVTSTGYEAGDEIDANNYTIEYVPGDFSNQGFTIKFNDTYEITTPVIIQYSSVIIEGYFKPGDTITNSAEMRGYGGASSEWEDRYYYTNVSGQLSETITAFTIRKVYTGLDGNEYSLSGATFYLYSSSKRYITNSGAVDENGKITFDPVTAGTYYLVETPPEGYVTDYADLENALELQVTVTGDQVTVSKRNDDGSLEVVSDQNGVITINNDTITGSFKLTKYKKDSEGNNTVNPLANAEFVLYKIDGETTLYYSGKDDNGICLFESESSEDAAVLVSDENGTIEESGIIEGVYYLQEIGAPVGFTVLDYPQQITVPVEGVYDVDLYDDMHLTDISGTKTWDDSGFEEYRPDSITVNLFRKTEEGLIPEKAASQEVTPDAEGNWNYTFDDLPVADENGNYYIYTIGEEQVDNYDAVSDDNGKDITNTFNPDVGSFKIIKYKNDFSGNNTENALANAKFVLYKLDGETKAYYSEKNDNGICIFDSESVDDAIVLVSDENGVIEESGLIAGEYYLEEIEAPEGYLPLAVPVSITISVDDVYAADLYDDLELIDISGTKTWDDAGYEEQRPESITVNLYRTTVDGAEAELVSSQEVTADAEGNWNYAFNDLPSVDDDGNNYTYTVNEEVVSGYDAAVEGYDITNTYIPEDSNPEVIAISGTKTWDDAGYEEQRPESITVNLYRTTVDGAEAELVSSQEVTADAEGNWNYAFSDLPSVDDDGNNYTYTVNEEVVSGYDAAVEGYDITNTYIPEDSNPEVIAISGTKTWDDAGYEEQRPESITVNLYRTTVDGAEAELVSSQEVTADAEGNWNYTFSDLPMVGDEGKLYTYTVNEEVVSGYDAAVEGYDITNTYKPDSDKDKTPNDTAKKGTSKKTTKKYATNAKTGDFANLILLWGILIASAGICGYALWRKFIKPKKK